MAENIGDISVDTGYAEAWMIYGDRTVKGVGGGVCQVSTTLFRTAFFGGFPIPNVIPTCTGCITTIQQQRRSK